MANIKEAFEYAAQNPTSDFANNLKSLAASGSLDIEAQKNGIDLTAFKPKQEAPQGETGLKGFATGMGKGVLSTIKGAGQLGETIGNAILPKSMESQSVYSDQATQGGLLDSQNLQAQGTAEKIGKGFEQIAEFAIPGTKVTNATKGANLLTKSLTRGATSATVAAVQQGEVGKDALIAGGIDAALPVVGKVVVQPVKKLIGRVLKGTGVALSGASGSQLDEILKNPEKAKALSKQLAKDGSDKVLENNVKTVINGVSKLNKDNSAMYGKGIESLAETDIKPDVFRKATQDFLDSYGIYSKDGQRILENVEFTDPKNIQKASTLIDKLQGVGLNGKDLRKLSNEIEISKWKTVGADADRLSFNRFADDLSNSIDSAINNSTSKLKEINANYSQTKQLTEAIQKELGNVDYKNLSEVVAASKKLETLFSKQGLAPKVIDDFLAKIGANDLKTSEAVRQVSTKELTTNTVGANPFEALRNISAAVVTPKMVKNVAIIMSISDKKASQILNKLGPTARATFIKSLTPKD